MKKLFLLISVIGVLFIVFMFIKGFILLNRASYNHTRNEMYNKGYNSATKSIEDGVDPQAMMDQVNTLEMDNFDRGWIDACKEHGAIEKL